MKDELEELISLTKLYLLGLPKASYIQGNSQAYSFFSVEKIPEKKEKIKIETVPPKKIFETPRKEIPVKEIKVEKRDEIVKVERKEDISLPSPHFALEKLPKSDEASFQDIAKEIKEKFPFFSIIEKYPLSLDDFKEKEFSPIMLLIFKEKGEEQKFLENLQIALSATLYKTSLWPASQLENEKKWDDLFQSLEVKLILMTEEILNAYPSLFQHYREIPKSEKKFLGKVPVIILPALSIYKKEPLLKKSLFLRIFNFFN
jgi:hypothetical protein